MSLVKQRIIHSIKICGAPPLCQAFSVQKAWHRAFSVQKQKEDSRTSGIHVLVEESGGWEKQVVRLRRDPLGDVNKGTEGGHRKGK